MNEMKWIEFIRVRSSIQAALREAMPHIQKQVREVEESAVGAETFFMQHALYDGDLAVALVWRGDRGPQKTREGLLVAEQLLKLGSIEHAVWIPTEQDGNPSI